MSMKNRPAKRITILRAGKPKRKFIVPPLPGLAIGDEVYLDGLAYIVVASQDTEVIIDILRRGNSLLAVVRRSKTRRIPRAPASAKTTGASVPING